MKVVSRQSSMFATTEWAQASRRVGGAFFALLLIAVLTNVSLSNVAWALEPAKSEPTLEERIQALTPALEAYIADGMKAFDLPGLAIGIVANDKLVYAKGFGVRSRDGGVPVDTRTVFQIGSTTKAFLATTLAIMVDRGKLRWDERVVDLDPAFQLQTT